jgi:hypothetical protein
VCGDAGAAAGASAAIATPEIRPVDSKANTSFFMVRLQKDAVQNSTCQLTSIICAMIIKCFVYSLLK